MQIFFFYCVIIANISDMLAVKATEALYSTKPIEIGSSILAKEIKCV